MDQLMDNIPIESLKDLEDLTFNINKHKDKIIDSTTIPKELLNNKKEIEGFEPNNLELIEG